MAEWFDRIRGDYQTAMSKPQTDGATRLLALIMGSGNKPKPQVPNYSAIPLTPSPFDVPYTGLTNTPAPPPMPQNSGPLPPFQQPGQQAAEYMPDRGLPSLSPPRQDNYGPGPSPAPAPMPTMPPVEVAASPMPDPRTMGDADLGGYGGMPRMSSLPAPQQYSHLNPTPSLEEVFRREYAANPMAFGGKFG